MLMSTAGTERLLDEKLPHEQRKLVERRLVVGEPAVFLELEFAVGFQYVDVVLEFSCPRLRLGDIVLELGRPWRRLDQRRFQLDNFAGESDQLLAKREPVEIRGEQRIQSPLRCGCVSAICIGHAKAFIERVYLVRHGRERRDANRIVRVDGGLYAHALSGPVKRKDLA